MLQVLVSFAISVLAGVVANRISKWLEERKENGE